MGILVKVFNLIVNLWFKVNVDQMGKDKFSQITICEVYQIKSYHDCPSNGHHDHQR